MSKRSHSVDSLNCSPESVGYRRFLKLTRTDSNSSLWSIDTMLSPSNDSSLKKVSKCLYCFEMPGKNDKVLHCYHCKQSLHIECHGGITDSHYDNLKTTDQLFLCRFCLPNYMVFGRLSESVKQNSTRLDALELGFSKYCIADDSHLKLLEKSITDLKSEIASIKSGTGNSVGGVSVENILDKISEKQARSTRIVGFNIPESPDLTRDLDKVRDIAKAINVDPSYITGCYRMGRQSNRPRLIKIRCLSSEAVTVFLSAPKTSLVDASRPKNEQIWFRPDLSEEERRRDKALRDDLKKIRSENSTNPNRFVIRNGKIVDKSVAQTRQYSSVSGPTGRTFHNSQLQ